MYVLVLEDLTLTYGGKINQLAELWTSAMNINVSLTRQAHTEGNYSLTIMFGNCEAFIRVK